MDELNKDYDMYDLVACAIAGVSSLDELTAHGQNECLCKAHRAVKVMEDYWNKKRRALDE